MSSPTLRPFVNNEPPIINNPGVVVVREGRRRYAVVSLGNRWGHFLLRRDAETFAADVRRGHAFLSEVGGRLVQGRPEKA